VKGTRQIAGLQPWTSGEQEFDLFMNLFRRIPWNMLLEIRAIQES